MNTSPQGAGPAFDNDVATNLQGFSKKIAN